MKKLLFILSVVASSFLISCGGGDANTTQTSEEPTSMVQDAASYDPKRGEGKFTADNIKLTAEIDPAMAAEGEKISNVKCISCHKLSAEKLVGPGWKGVTSRRAPEWIMNFITNPNVMLDKDPEAKAMLEICLVRMPNQNLSDNEARQVLEFIRKNDK